MTTASEAALAALYTALPTPAGGAKRRNVSAPEEIPAGGMIVLRDGTRGDPVEEYLNPHAGVYRHAAELQLLVQGTDDTARTAAIDALVELVRPAIAADRTLGGTVDHVEFQRGAPRDVTEEGVAPIRVEDATVILEYLEEI